MNLQPLVTGAAISVLVGFMCSMGLCTSAHAAALMHHTRYEAALQL